MRPAARIPRLVALLSFLLNRPDRSRAIDAARDRARLGAALRSRLSAHLRRDVLGE
jgi:hypothetical protein